MTRCSAMRIGGLLAGVFFWVSPASATGYGDAQPRAMGLAGTYTALARGTESIYWNPANLALRDSPKYSFPQLFGVNLIAENNSFSVSDYNKYNGEDIDAEASSDLLSKIPKEGMKLNTDVGVVVPILNGMAFPMPWNLSSAIAFNVRTGFEGEMPKDMFALMLRGNEFGKEYDIAKWDGSGWGLVVFNWAAAKPWMPGRLKPYFDEFTVGGTFKVLGGAYTEVLRSEGGFVTLPDGVDVSASATARGGGGWGLGLDLGAAGVTKDRKTTFSAALVNFFDFVSWSIEPKQHKVFVTADNLRVTRFTGTGDIEEVLDNPRNEKGEVVLDEKVPIESFRKSLPAMLRIGAAHQYQPKLIVAANYDQAFSSGFGISAVPKVSVGLEYTLVDWFPVRFGLSAGGRGGMSSAIGFAIGPFALGRVRLTVLEFSTANRGGFLPGLAKGTGLSLNLLQVRVMRI